MLTVLCRNYTYSHISIVSNLRKVAGNGWIRKSGNRAQMGSHRGQLRIRWLVQNGKTNKTNSDLHLVVN